MVHRVLCALVWSLQILGPNLPTRTRATLQYVNMFYAVCVYVGALYKTHPKDAAYKTPSGAACALCCNLFRMMDLSLKYKNFNGYWKFVSQGSNRHQPFLEARKKLVRELGRNPSFCRLKGKAELRAGWEQALMSIETSGRQWEQDLDFVEKDQFLKENKDKGLVEGKDYKLKWEVIDGEWKEGVFIRLQQTGHHKLKIFDGKRVARVS